jgi:2-C-methyl-D-erythritol 4-phosphate cytidylyltransferase
VRHHDAVPVWGIVVAAGGGERFGGVKQLESLGAARVVDRAVAIAADACDGVVVVVPPGADWQWPAALTTPGGATRSASVRAGLGNRGRRWWR